MYIKNTILRKSKLFCYSSAAVSATDLFVDLRIFDFIIYFHQIFIYFQEIPILTEAKAFL